jgi:phosphotransferase system HPr (HPr) family protein
VAPDEEYSADVVIKNPMGFHVRPVQRFAELARIFKAEVGVQLRRKSVPGKSVMNLMSLGGRCGDTMRITARGEDARQCVGVLKFLAENDFFVEDNLDGDERPRRHLERLAAMASCFDSSIQARVDDKTADAKQLGALEQLGLTPRSEPELQIGGDDAEQARAVLTHLVKHSFFIEAEMAQRKSR